MKHLKRSSAGLFAAVALAAVGWLGTLPAFAADAKTTTPAGYEKAGFELLAGYPFIPAELDPSAPAGTPPPSGAKQIPPAVKALDGKKVVVTGYMMPTKLEKGFVKEFLLMASAQLCCYGTTPQVNEFIVVKMNASNVKPVMDTPVQFFGKLVVKEMYEDGFLTNIYSLEGERMGKAGVD